MKSRIQLAGVAHRSLEKVLWNGDLPPFSGIPGMRIVLYTPPGTEPGEKMAEEVTAFQFKQVILEINTKTGEYEQVVYVSHVDRTKLNEITG